MPPLAAPVRSSLHTILPGAAGLPGLDACDLDGFLRDLHRDAPPTVWWGLVGAALAFQLAPLLTLGIPWVAAGLPPRLRDRHAARCATTRIYLLRQATFLLKTFAGACWGADPHIRRRLLLDRPPATPPDR
jgi:hypothetical protein